jgi:hypothetical protein
MCQCIADHHLQASDKLFKRAVMDVSWTPDGMCLIACSLDGTIAAFQFEESDLGRCGGGRWGVCVCFPDNVVFTGRL